MKKILPILFISFFVNNTLAWYPDPTGSSYMGGVTLSFTARDAYMDMEREQGQIHLPRENPLFTGILLGKRFALFDLLRLQIQGQVEFAKVNEDTTPQIKLDNGQTEALLMQSSFFSGGIIPEIQYPIRFLSDLIPYVAVGGGLHYVSVQEQEHIWNNPDVRILDPYLETHGSVALSVHTGVGFDIARGNYGLNLYYCFRYWNPVSYNYSRDLFPYNPRPYHERFLTNSLNISFLLRR